MLTVIMLCSDFFPVGCQVISWEAKFCVQLTQNLNLLIQISYNVRYFNVAYLASILPVTCILTQDRVTQLDKCLFFWAESHEQRTLPRIQSFKARNEFWLVDKMKLTGYGFAIMDLKVCKNAQ